MHGGLKVYRGSPAAARSYVEADRGRADDYYLAEGTGVKSWSLAAALDPEIAAAYDGAQDRAAQQVIGWLAQHASTRVGPRGHQVQGLDTAPLLQG